MGRQKLRARLTKGVEIRFISHLEFMGTVEKVVRRAQLPIAFSQGYHPQPQIAPASALPVGHSSEAEYADFTLARAICPADFMGAFNSKSPSPLQVKSVREVALDTPSLMSQVNLARWEVELSGVEGADIPANWSDFAGQSRIPVSKRSKKGWKELDARPLLVESGWTPAGEDRWRLDLQLRVGEGGSLRPEELLQAFLAYCGLEGWVERVKRQELLVIMDGEVASPLDPVVAPEPDGGKGEAIGD